MNTNAALFHINIKSPIAVYVQIENQVMFAIAAGKYQPGDTVPSVRDMSQILNVNPNTVTKAYRDLELLGFVTTRRGVGVTVSEKAPKLCKDRVSQMVRSHLEDALGECIASGLKAAEIRSAVSKAIDASVVPYHPDRVYS
ncbi:MAG: GntR family transcriptional regulator [Candidatus Hydrogenedentota bacterium]